MNTDSLPHHEPEDNADRFHTNLEDPGVREALERLSASIDVDHLLICFQPNDHVAFYPDTFFPQRLYGRLRGLVQLFREHPRAMRCAAGACGRGHQHKVW